MSVKGKKDKVARVLISIDCILDTRLGTIMDIDPNLVDKILVNKEFNYHERLVDEFPYINKTIYDERYLNRDISILSQSMVTNLFGFLIEMHKTLQTEIKTKPDIDDLQYVINTYPYLLTPTELADLILCFRFNMKDQDIKVTTIWAAPEKITPEFCNTDITAMFMYDYELWLSIHANKLSKVSLHDITLFAPMIYKEKTPTDDDINEFKETGMSDPFMIVSTALREMIELFFLPINEFSVYKPNN